MNLMCTIAKERLQRDHWEQQAQDSVGTSKRRMTKQTIKKPRPHSGRGF
nr:hypothetical protein P5621_15855 [Bacillus subtilis]WGD91489.1 hypothetical protein P5665_12140 [Bacillus subtilis]